MVAIPSHRWVTSISNLALGLALCGLCMFGIRGRTGYNPIKVSAAYFCDNPIMNQLGVNPAFCLLQSTLDDRRAENKRLHLMDDDKAVAKTIAHTIEEFTTLFSYDRPDLLLVLGDRYEMFAVCTAASALGVPIAHISGGDVTVGAKDDFYRHCMTAMA
ncbi:MAG: UDP-N-acetylglucosamine 2-epimerase, partial [Bacteroidaceae bacterium]|nr:UDP-N-acetylglucosamine 2-epimerase [Bacteroidaceae bacterium]